MNRKILKSQIMDSSKLMNMSMKIKIIFNYQPDFAINPEKIITLELNMCKKKINFKRI